MISSKFRLAQALLPLYRAVPPGNRPPFPASGPVEVQEGLVHLAFEVEDLDETMNYLEKKGIPITDGPTDTRSGDRFCFIDAPDRYEIELIQRKKA